MGEHEEQLQKDLSLGLIYLVQAATAARESYHAGQWASVEKSLRSVQERAAWARNLLGQLGEVER